MFIYQVITDMEVHVQISIISGFDKVGERTESPKGEGAILLHPTNLLSHFALGEGQTQTIVIIIFKYSKNRS